MNDATQIRESHPAPAAGAEPCPAISIMFVQIQGVYDGVLIFHCEVCGAEWPRFPEEDWRHAKALEIIEARRAHIPEPQTLPEGVVITDATLFVGEKAKTPDGDSTVTVEADHLDFGESVHERHVPERQVEPHTPGAGYPCSVCELPHVAGCTRDRDPEAVCPRVAADWASAVADS